MDPEVIGNRLDFADSALTGYLSYSYQHLHKTWKEIAADTRREILLEWRAAVTKAGSAADLSAYEPSKPIVEALRERILARPDLGQHLRALETGPSPASAHDLLARIFRLAARNVPDRRSAV